MIHVLVLLFSLANRQECINIMYVVTGTNSSTDTHIWSTVALATLYWLLMPITRLGRFKYDSILSATFNTHVKSFAAIPSHSIVIESLWNRDWTKMLCPFSRCENDVIAFGEKMLNSYRQNLNFSDSITMPFKSRNAHFNDVTANFIKIPLPKCPLYWHRAST